MTPDYGRSAGRPVVLPLLAKGEIVDFVLGLKVVGCLGLSPLPTLVGAGADGVITEAVSQGSASLAGLGKADHAHVHMMVLLP